MPAETVDVLELQIRSRAEDAAQQIENLATSVADFGKNVRRYISNLNDFSAALTAIADAASKLSNTRGLGKVLEKVAPVAAAMKAKTPVTKAAAMSAQTKEAQFRRAYADVFPSRAAQKGMYPGKIVRLANDSAMVMDQRDINKRSVSALSGRIRSQYGMDRYTKSAAMNELITKVRAGAGRYDGANQAWMTQDAQNALRELAEYVVASARPENDSDLIARIRSGGNASLSLGKLDKAQLKQADMSVSSLRALLRDAGIGYSATGTGSKAEDFGRYMGKEYGTIMDLVEGLKNAYERRNQNFIDEKGGSGGREAAIEAVEKELLSEILDVEARNERVETAPDAKVPMDALRSAYEESQKAAEPEIKQEAEQAAVEIKEAVKETVKAETEAATGAFKGKSNAAEYAAIKEAARIADEQAERAKLELALGDNTPALIAANRSRFNSAGMLDGWNQMYGQNIPGLADRGLAAGLIDEDTAQAMKDAAEGVEHISEAAKDATASMGELGDAMADVAEQAEDAEENCIGLRDVLKAAGSTIGNSFLGKLTGQLIRVAKMRGLRAVVKMLASGFKEGMNNLYGWSDAISGHFAGAMDTIATKAMYAKNSIATAFAPAIEALVPILSTVVNWIHAASNALAQFIALLTGQSSWTEATESAEKWGDAAKGAGGAAKKAAKEAKDLLADWDELNIIQSKTDDSTGGGGGGGGAGTNYADMFKENFKFDEWTRYFEQIKNIAIAIGVAIAGWKLIDMASTFLKKIGFAKDTVDTIAENLGKALTGIVLLTIGFQLAEIAGADMAHNGVTLENALTALGSMVSAALGGYFLASAINPALGVVGAIAGLTLDLAIGFKAYVDEKRKILYENIDAYLEAELSAKVFKFDVNALVERVNTTIANVTKARKDVQTQLSKVLTNINVLKLGVNTGDSWTEIYNQVVGAGGLIDKIQTQLTEEKNVITLYYETKDRKGLEGAANGATVANGMRTELLANDWLSKKYAELGRDFASKFTEGEVAGIKDGQAEAAMAIFETIVGAKAAAEKAMGEAGLEIELLNKKNALDDEAVMDELASLFEENEEKIAESRKKAAEEHYTMLKGEYAELKELGADETLLQGIEEQIKKAKAELEANEFKINVHAEFVEDEKKMFGEELVRLYGPQLAEYVSALAGEGLSDAQFINAVLDAGGYDEYVQNQVEEILRELPQAAGKWLLDNGINIEDFLTDEQKALIQAGKSRFEGAGGGPMTEPIEIADSGVTEEIRDSAGAVEENTLAVTELTGAMEEFVPNEPEKTEDPVVKELGETEKLISDYFTEVQDYYRSGDMNGLLEAEDRLNSAFYDKPEVVGAIVDAVWDYAEAQTDNKWLESPEVPSELANILSTGISIDAATSGMALDSTMENIGNALSGQNDTTNSLLDKVASRMVDLLTATNNLANRPVQVNLGVSSLFGDYFGRSNAAYGKATNG